MNTGQGQRKWTGGGVAALLRARTNLDPGQMLSNPDIAKRWGVGEMTVWRRITAGELPASNIGTAQRARYRVRLADLLAYELNQGWPVPDLPDLGPDDVA